MSRIVDVLKRFYLNSTIGRMLLYLPQLLYSFYLFYILGDEEFIKTRFKRVFGFNINLSNPQTLNEKIQWLKLNNRNPIQIDCSDKVKVRDFIEKKVGSKYLIPAILINKQITLEDLKKLPESFVIKSNSGSGNNKLVLKEEKLNLRKTLHEIKKWKKDSHYRISKEWQYKDIPHQYIVEELLLTNDGEIPSDIKFHCFNGKVEFIQVDTDRFKEHKRSFFDINWNLLPFNWCLFKDGKPVLKKGGALSKPKSLEEMIEVSECLAEEFEYVRIDLYSIDEKIYFGEMTFHHGSGFEQFVPFEYDKIFGKKLKLNILSIN